MDIQVDPPLQPYEVMARVEQAIRPREDRWIIPPVKVKITDEEVQKVLDLVMKKKRKEWRIEK